jgi:hypothetical protein
LAFEQLLDVLATCTALPPGAWYTTMAAAGVPL